MTRWSDPPPQGPTGSSGRLRRARQPPADDDHAQLRIPPPPGDRSPGPAGEADDPSGAEPEGDLAQPWLEREGLGGQLHPAAIGVWSLQVLGALAAVAVINIVNQGGLGGFMVVVLVLVVAALALAVNAVRWSRFHWRLADDTLIISQGLLQRHHRVIPLERIQSVDVVRRVSHRLFRVEALNVEAVGGSDTEGQLDALHPRVARRVRAALLAGRDAAREGDDPHARVSAALAGDDLPVRPDRLGDAAPDDGEQLVRCGPAQLIRAGATEANVTVLAAAAGFGWQLVSDRVEEIARRVPTVLGPGVAVAVVLGLLLVALVLLILGQLITYWNFRLTHTESELRIRRGLLEQRFDTVPLRRVQALRIEENLPRRLLGYASVKADVAGKPGGGSTGTDTLLPFGTAAEARQLVATILDDPDAATASLHAMPRRARARRRLRAVLATAVITAAAVATWGLVGMAAVVVAVPALAAADAAYRALGWTRDHGLLVARAGWWTRRTAFVPEHRLQTLARTATLLQRRRRLATVELHIARSPGLWSGPRWIDLDAGEADRQTVDLSEALAAMPPASSPRPRGAPAEPATQPAS